MPVDFAPSNRCRVGGAAGVLISIRILDKKNLFWKLLSGESP
jgi:hypothetical protein